MPFSFCGSCIYLFHRDLTHELSLAFQVKRRYRIAPTPAYSDRRRTPSMLLLDDRQKGFMKVDKAETITLTKSQIDLELAKIRSMTPQEAAAVAARAVAEAEAAIAEAEEAAKEAEAAEADAEAAEAFADAAMKTLKGRNNPKVVKLDFAFLIILFVPVFVCNTITQ